VHVKPASNPPILLTVREVADRLSVSRSRVYELLGRGLLESVRIGRSRRVPLDALDRFVAALREEVQSDAQA
jgi:excisionase family DNA binding protein